MKNKIEKALFRLFRILGGKKGIYCKTLGKKNKFTKGVFVEEGAEIGSYNYFGPYTMINNAKIGNYCSIAPSVKIGQGQHSIDNVTTYQSISKKILGHSLNTAPSILKNDIWCGANVVIMQGVTIGNGAVIGANSVVTKDVPDYAIVIGSPAKILRYRLSEEIISEINKSEWYNKDFNEAMDIVKNLEEKVIKGAK